MPHRVRVVSVALFLAAVATAGILLATAGPWSYAHSLPAATPHLELDMDITNGDGPCNPVDSTAEHNTGGTYGVAICLTDSEVPPAAFFFTLAYDRSLNQCVPTAICPPQDKNCLDSNPDANAGMTAFSTPDLGPGGQNGWYCNYYEVLPPQCDWEPQSEPAVARAVLDCLTIDPPTLPAGQGVSAPLAVAYFVATNAGTDQMFIDQAEIYDYNLEAILQCDAGSPCFGGTDVKIGEPVTPLPSFTPTTTPTPTATRTPRPTSTPSATPTPTSTPVCGGAGQPPCTPTPTATSTPGVTPAPETRLTLDGDGVDMEVDAKRGQIYVSVPSKNEIEIVSTDGLELLGRIPFPAKAPMGLALGLDGDTLYVALNEAGAVGVVDLDTMRSTEIVVGSEMKDYRVYDVVEARPNRLYVSGDPGSEGTSYLVLVKLDVDDEVTRLGSRIIRASPELHASPDSRYLYVGEGFSPNSLYKFDIGTDDAQLVLEDDHGSVSGTDRLEVSPDGSQIYLRSGQVLRTDSFVQVGSLSPGVPELSADGDTIFVGADQRIRVYDRMSLVETGRFNTSCTATRMGVDPGGWGIFVLDNSSLCRLSLGANPTPAPHTPMPSPTPTPVFTPVPETRLDLSAQGFDVEADPARGQLYVSVPSVDEVEIVSMDDLQITGRIPFPGKAPRGIDLSFDGNTLYVALNQAGAVTAVDLNTMQSREIPVAAEMGDSRVWDIVVGKPNRLYVSGNPSIYGISFLVMVKLDEGDSVSRLWPHFSAYPELAASPDMQYLYVGEQYSPNSLYKFDITTDVPSLVLEDVHGTVSGTDRLELDPDGSRVFLKSGQVLRANSFVQAARISYGVPKLSVDRDLVYVGAAAWIDVFDSSSLVEFGRLPTACSAIRMALGPESSTLFVLGGTSLCRLDLGPSPTPTPTSTPVTPHPSVTPHGVGGKVLLPPAAIADSANGESGGPGASGTAWAALALVVAMVAAASICLRFHRRRR